MLSKRSLLNLSVIAEVSCRVVRATAVDRKRLPQTDRGVQHVLLNHHPRELRVIPRRQQRGAVHPRGCDRCVCSSAKITRP